MPLGPIIGALAGGAASAGVTALAGKLFGGGGTAPISSAPADVNAGGLRSTFRNNTATVTPSSERTGLVGKIASTFPGQASLLQQLRMSVTPGMSAMRAARLAQLEADRQASTGDLRDNLARRRILGSSFAQDALTRSDLAYAQQKDAIVADSFLQELQMNQQLTNAEFTARRDEFQTQLDELNLEADMATQIASSATSQLGANARLKAQLDSQAAAGAGKFFGGIGASVGDAVSKALTAPRTATA